MWVPPVKEAFTCVQGEMKPDNHYFGERESAISCAMLAHIQLQAVLTRDSGEA